MGGKIAIVIVSDWDQKLKVTSALHVSKRIYDAKEENGIESVEVFLYAGGAKLLQAVPQEIDQLLNELMQSLTRLILQQIQQEGAIALLPALRPQQLSLK